MTHVPDQGTEAYAEVLAGGLRQRASESGGPDTVYELDEL